MSQVKLPQIGVALKSEYDAATKEDTQWNQVNPSCLLAYLGIRGSANITEVTTKNVSKNALPILAYYDIFKNDYAYRDWETDRKSTRLNSSHRSLSRMPSSA